MRRSALLVPALFWALAAHAGDVTVRINVAPGLKFDPERFSVSPGDRVTVEFHNPDEMIHNFVVTAPGERLKVVSAALELGNNGPGRNFVPDLKEVLWSTRALNPGETASLSFTAPQREGVYPYVCTFPGHGFLMYGAMYVTSGALPPIESDPNIPPVVAPAKEVRDGLLRVDEHPVISRTFLPDCGPSAIAVGMPGGQSYCYDASACRLRYIWKGGFVDNTDQWAGKGDLWSSVVGRVYFRAPRTSWLRLGRPDRIPVFRWEGYRMVEGYPQFMYTMDGVQTRELIRPKSGGVRFTIEVERASGPVFLVTEGAGGAKFGSEQGSWKDGTLSLTAAEAERFTVDLDELPKAEPLGYWSMNDALWGAERDPEPGVLGRAFTPGGLERTPRILNSGITVSALREGATLVAWVKKKKGGAAFAPIFSAGDSFVVQDRADDDQWHHIAVVLPAGGGEGRRFIDGAPAGAETEALPAADLPLEIGSEGTRFLAGLLDEMRIYDREVPESEINAIYVREAKEGGILSR